MPPLSASELHIRREALAFSISQAGGMAVTMWGVFGSLGWLGWQAGRVWPVVVMMSMATVSAAWRFYVVRLAGDLRQLDTPGLLRVEFLVQSNMLFAGLMWAFATITIYPHLALPAAIVYVASQFAALAFTAFFVSAMRSGFLLHAVPMMGTLFVVTLWQQHDHAWMLAALVGVYALVMTQASRRFRHVSLLAFSRGYEMQQSNVELRQAMLDAEAAVQAKTRFLATMSHELRTPMNGLLGALDLLTHAPLANQERHLVDIARSSGSGLLLLLDDVLDYAKVDAGLVALKLAPMAPRELVDSVVNLFAPTALAKGLALRAEVHAAVPAWVQADPQRLRQVLLNLVGNALKFTAQGEVVVRVMAGTPGLRIEVQDTGIGISADDQQQLFQAFRQLDNHSNRRYEGTGLGLVISQRLVQAMGGLIDVTSMPGAGACFGFTLALPEVAPPAPSQGPAAPRAGASQALSGRVLMVEDNTVNRCVAQQMLSLIGLEVVEAQDGDEALRLLHEQRFDLVLMDCEMPHKDGYETIREWRHHEASAGLGRLPVLALTANTQSADLQRAMVSGMDDVLCKPIGLDLLRDTLRRWLPNQQS